MIRNDDNEIIYTNNSFTHYVGIKFPNTSRSYYFGSDNLNLNLGDKVVVESAKGIEIGEVSIAPVEIEKYTSELALKPVLRIATDIDLKMAENNKKDARFAMNICQEEVNRLGLEMNLVSCEYSLDKAKVLFSYLSEDRVDFRELLKVLASKLHTRIELRQIGARDKAKMVGGLGPCGLPLCCSTFLNEFDGISIQRAKNQMLAINIPKLSGQCGKLICCLKYEDDAYLQERRKYPELGSKVFLDNQEYTISSVNIISSIIKIENADDVKFIPYEDLKKQASFKKNHHENNEKK